ncbi:MAG: conjugal transfer protein TraH [Litorimonas sp.]
MAIGTANTARAQVGSAMDSYYNQSKGMSRYTGPGSYEGQSRTTLSLGSYGWRAPQSQVQIASMQLPSASGGCGGIDIYGGAFSYINGEQLKNLFRNIVQNAKGFAFKMAVDTISSQISEQLEVMDFKLQDMNDLMLDSCQAAEVLVNNAAVRIEAAARTDCKVRSTNTGKFKDYFSASLDCDDGSATANTAGSGAVETPYQLTDRNYAFTAAGKHPLYGSDTTMKEFLMTLVGTIIIRTDGSNASQTVSAQAVAPETLDTGILSTILWGGDMKIHRCTGSDCLSFVPLGRTLSITNDMAYAPRVAETLGEIIDTMADPNAAFTAEHAEFVNRSGIQVYELLRQMADRDPSMARAFAFSMADLLATEMVLGFLIEQNTDMLRYGKSLRLTGVDPEMFEAWEDGILENLRTLRAMKADLSDQFVANAQSIELLNGLRRSNSSAILETLFADG